MRLRTKLLLLLLLVSVVPILVVGVISFYSLADLGTELAGDTADALLEDAKTQLQDIVDENGKLIGLSTVQLDMAVRVQQVAAKRALVLQHPPKQKHTPLLHLMILWPHRPIYRHYLCLSIV